ncbi:hypothetical protein [Anoxybacteroides rupiense]|uniref:hypothetical protein n=1 Tax=Anoxybacteroides rupiense TaxID=311460 RepID=UPI002013124F|nr:hypothetical protein [Anoxybacillus rupiensis]
MKNQNGDPLYYAANYRGDVVRVVDENGTTVANYSYDPWGKGFRFRKMRPWLDSQ